MAATVTVTAGVDVAVQVGYSSEPGWTYQWRSIQRHLGRLREQYRGIDPRGNVDVEETVHSLFIALFHLGDWLAEDDSTALNLNMVRALINQSEPLRLCQAYAVTRKHAKPRSGRALMAQILTIISGAGYRVVIGYRPQAQSDAPFAEVDALELAESAEREWRARLAERDIPIPP